MEARERIDGGEVYKVGRDEHQISETAEDID